MSLNLSIQLFCAVLASCSLMFLRIPEKERDQYDRCLFWGASALLVAFATFRPLGVGVDDFGGYANVQFDMTCPAFECGQWIQGERDQGWYSLVGLLKSFYPHPQVALWLSGLGLAVKLWVIDRLCRHRSLALLFYIACFYIIHDITALRVSLAISVYLLGFYWLVQGRLRWGAGWLAVNGFFHQQAFVAPLLLAGRWLPLTPQRAQLGLLLPLVLLVMGVYPGDALFHWLMGSGWGRSLVSLLLHGYESYKLAGTYDHTRLWPVVAPPALFLAAWLIGDLFDRHRVLFQYTATSLIVAALFLWGYAVQPDVQLRFWHFFLVPIVFVIGNVQLTRWKLVAILALSAVYLLKYTVMHDLLLDQRQVHWDTPVGGQIVLQTPAIACGEGCGFNVTQGTAATVQATAEMGYRFAGWSGACQGGEPVCTVTVDDDLSLGARFVKTAAVALTVEGQGTVTPSEGAACPASCEWHPDAGAEWSLMAVPAAGWRFAGWAGACRDGEPRCALTMTADQTVTARFVPVFALTVETVVGGQVMGLTGDTPCTATCVQPLDGGSVLKLQAVAESPHRFAGWEGGCSGVDPLCEVTLDAEKTVKARFVPTVQLTLQKTGEGVVRSEAGSLVCGDVCSGRVDVGAEQVLQAEAAAGWRFTGWSGSPCEGQAATCRVTPAADGAVTATFVRTHGVQSAASEWGDVWGVSVSGASPALGPWTIDEGAVLLLTPVAKAGARFDHWVVGCVGTGLCPLMVTQDQAVSAAFRLLPAYPLRLTVRGQGQVNSEPAGVACGQGPTAGSCRGEFSDVTLRAVPAAGFVFRGWAGCAAASHPVCTTTLNRASAITAEFVQVPRHEMKVTVTGPGAVQGLVKGQACVKAGRACRTMVVQGGEVALTAVPEDGHFFVGWSGACAGREVTCRVPVSGTVGVGAVFQ